jgi:TPR repeat protein
VGENLTLVRRSAFGQRIFYWSLGIGFVVGLAAQWCRKTADAGNTRAMFSLGALLAEQGEEDQAEQGEEDQAEQWYRKAADAGRRDG